VILTLKSKVSLIGMQSFTWGKAVVEPLYLEDSYLRGCDAEVRSVEGGRYVILDRTIFHPEGGGQPWDTGEVIRGDEGFRVVYVRWLRGLVSHEVDRAGLEPGERVRCLLDWGRRYRSMRLHTALHILWAALTRSIPGLEIVSSEIGLERSRFDVRADRSTLIEGLSEIEAVANRIVGEDRPVRVRMLGRVEAERLLRSYGEDLSQLPRGEVIRIVEIPEWDVAACLGTHVRSTGEVGSIRILRRASKGRGIDRIYFTAINR
jgi:Ser-tRNA(Ala) deacylase AlaX